MNNISRRNFALVELFQCIKPSVGLLHYVVEVHCPSEVLRKMDTGELKCRDLFNIGPTNRDWARNATIVVKKVTWTCIYGGLSAYCCFIKQRKRGYDQLLHSIRMANCVVQLPKPPDHPRI